ncbi:MAG: PilZ domain-containing protein [Planctomycetes bacterium]|nr:PilZ domain-containing protein [Planctomycetota bacterium]
MGGASDVIAEALEANRVKEALFSQHARTVGRMATHLLDAARSGKQVHTLGEGPRAALGAYLADVLFRAGLPARPLPAPDDDGALLRAVDAFVQAGDVVLLVAHEARPGLERALLRARARGAACLGLLGEPCAGLAAHVDLPVTAPTPRAHVAAEALLGVGHLLVGLVAEGLRAGPGRQAQGSGVSSSHAGRALDPAPPPQPPPRPPPLPAPAPPPAIVDSALGFVSGFGGATSGVGSRVTDLGVIDEDPLASGDDTDDEATDEAALLAEAVEGAVAPPTDPRGLRRKRAAARPAGPAPTPAPAPAPAPGLLRFRCGGCEEPIVVEERHAGRRGQCPHCRIEFVIPRPQVDITATQRAAVVPRGAQQQQAPRRPEAGQSKAERRRAARITVKDALVRFDKGDFPAAGAYHEPHVLEDLSLTGMRFLGRSKAYEVGDVLCFALDFPAFPEPVRVKGEVRRVVRLKNGAGFGAGVRFVQYHGDAEARVRRLLESAPLRAVRRR